MAELLIGKKVPAFKALGTSGVKLNSNKMDGKYLVLFFYPKDATPGCTIEGHEFTKLHKKFKALGAEVFGISRDSLKSHEKFKEKQCYSVDLLSDEDETICTIFDVVKDKNMYGKKVRGIERSTFVIDPAGKLAMEWRKVKAEGHAQQVYDWLKQNT